MSELMMRFSNANREVNRGGRTFARGMAWLLTGLLLCAVAAGALETRDSLFGQAQVRYRETAGSLSSDDLRLVRGAIEDDEASAGMVAGWAQTLSQSVSVKETSGSVSVDALWIDGDASLVLNLTPVRGALPRFDGGADCAIDQEAASKLFGSLDVVGEAVVVNGEALTVRSVFAMPGGLTSLAADPGRGLILCDFSEAPEDTLMDTLAFSIQRTNGLTPAEQAQKWMSDASVSARGEFGEATEQRAMIRFLTFIPSYLMMAFCAALLGKAYVYRTGRAYRAILQIREDPFLPARDERRVLYRYILTLLVIALFGAGAMLLSPGLPAIPPSYLPTRWSDFAFFSDRFSGMLETVAKNAFTVARRTDLYHDRLTSIGMWTPLVSAFALWRAHRAFRKGVSGVSFLPLLLSGILLILFVPASLFLVRRMGLIPAATAGTLGLPVLWFFLMSIMKGAHTK